MIARALFAAALAAASPASAAASEANSHIKTVFYQADGVTEIAGALGWQMMIEFAPDERIENVSIGNSTAWQVAPNKRARALFLKPLRAKASTNMIVVTSARTYTFELTDRAAPRFDPVDRALRVLRRRPSRSSRPPASADQSRLRLTLAGDAALLPARVWDDGRQTYFEFGEETALPAIFAGAGQDESLVNVTMRGRIAVVQQRATRFTLRSGKRIATVIKQP